MHDGRFFNVDAVLEHYNSQVVQTSNLDSLLRSNGKTGISLNEEEKGKLLIFLNTLNDRNFITNPLIAEQ